MPKKAGLDNGATKDSQNSIANLETDEVQKIVPEDLQSERDSGHVSSEKHNDELSLPSTEESKVDVKSKLMKTRYFNKKRAIPAREFSKVLDDLEFSNENKNGKSVDGRSEEGVTKKKASTATAKVAKEPINPGKKASKKAKEKKVAMHPNASSHDESKEPKTVTGEAVEETKRLKKRKSNIKRAERKAKARELKIKTPSEEEVTEDGSDGVALQVDNTDNSTTTNQNKKKLRNKRKNKKSEHRTFDDNAAVQSEVLENGTITSDVHVDADREETEENKKSMNIPINSSEKGTVSDDTSPFDIKLRPVRAKALNKKYPEKLPPANSIKTVVGLSHLQIAKLDLSDVKVKTIVTCSSICKYATRVLNFTRRFSDELFSDEKKRNQVTLLCLNVALYGSIGYKKTLKVYPNLLEILGSYEDLNLEKTGTKITPSEKVVHQNDFDYSILTYIGFIILWAIGQEDLAEKLSLSYGYNESITKDVILNRVGGLHLWDKIIRDPSTINSKRWKHIIKYRQTFSFAEDQFVLILRFMKLIEL